MKHDLHLTIESKNPNGGVMVNGTSLNTYKGEVIFKECNEQEYTNLIKLSIGSAIEVEEYPGVKLEIVKDAVIYSENSIGFYVKTKIVG